MKKVFVTLFAIAATSVIMAQSLTTTFVQQIPSYIPQMYTTNDQPSLAVLSYDEDADNLTMTVYNSLLQPTGDPINVPTQTVTTGYRFEWRNTTTHEWEPRPGYHQDMDEDMVTPMATASGTIGGAGINDLTGFLCTQTLFNNDANYEFIMPIVSIMGDTDTWNDYIWIEEESRSIEAEVRTIRTRVKCTGFKVQKADGTVLNTVNFPANCYLEANISDGMFLNILVRLGNYSYLAFPVEKRIYDAEGNYDYGETQILVYNINAATQTISQVDINLPFNVFPSFVNNNNDDYITVDLGDNGASEIRVVNSLGQVVKVVPVQQGQREVKISTKGLSTGVNFVNAQGQKASGSYKIVVR